MMLIGLVVFLVAVPMGRILGFAIPFIDLLLIALGVMLLAGINPFMQAPGRSGSPALAVRSRRPTSTACSWGRSRCPVPVPSWWPCWPSRSAPPSRSGALATFFVFGLGFGLPLVLLSVLARARQDTVVRFLARHHRKIEIVSGVLLIGAGIWDLWINWESILLTFGY